MLHQCTSNMMSNKKNFFSNLSKDFFFFDSVSTSLRCMVVKGKSRASISLCICTDVVTKQECRLRSLLNKAVMRVTRKFL